MSAALEFALQAALAVHVLLIAVCVARTWRGENVVDRLLGADLTGALTVAALVLLSLLRDTPMYIDIALSIAALGVIGTLALARHLAERGGPEGRT
jgi:multisubunit Na+/H+ antiporter MnhF subunit